MCDCASCDATQAVKLWPRATGDVQQFKIRALDQLPPEKYPTEKLARMDRAYRAHVAYALRGGIDRAIPAHLLGFIYMTPSLIINGFLHS